MHILNKKCVTAKVCYNKLGISLTSPLANREEFDSTSQDIHFANIIFLHIKFSRSHYYILYQTFQVVARTIEVGEDDSALKVLIELAESAPKFLRTQLESIFQVCIKVL